MGPDAVVLKCDFQNAFNERNASKYYMNSLLKSGCDLSGGYLTGHTKRLRAPCLTMGTFVRPSVPSKASSKAMVLDRSYFRSVQWIYRLVTREAKHVRCVAVADDLNLVGPAGEVLRAFDNLSVDIRDTGLRLRASKCGLLWPTTLLLSAAAARSLPISQGCMVTLGAPVGFDQVRMDAWLREKVDSHSRFFKLLLRPDLPVQVAFLLLRQCLIPSMGYLARVVSLRTRPTLLLSMTRSFAPLPKNWASLPSLTLRHCFLCVCPFVLGGLGFVLFAKSRLLLTGLHSLALRRTFWTLFPTSTSFFVAMSKQIFLKMSSRVIVPYAL